MHKQSSISFGQFLELSEDILCTIDKDGYFNAVSPSCEEIWGYKPKELEGKLVQNFAAPKELKETTEHLQNIKKGKEKVTFEIHVLHKEGHLVLTKWNAKYDENQELIYCIATQSPKKILNSSEENKILSATDTLINGTQNLIWSIDKNYNLIAFNLTMRRRFLKELDIELKIGQNLLHLPNLSDKYIERWKILYDKCLAGHEVNTEIHSKEVHPNKSAWMKVNLTPVYNNDVVIGLVCYSSEITEKKEIEIELAKNNQLVQNILEHIPMGVAVNEISTGKQMLINKEFITAYGWPEKDLTDVQTFFEKVYPDPEYRKEISQRIITDMESGDINRMTWNEIQVRTQQGKNKYVDAKNIPLIEQDLMISTVIDVTEKVKAKEKIEQALKEKRVILESISDAFYALDSNYNFTYINQSALSTIGKPNENLIGKNLFKEFPLLKETVFVDFIEEAKKTGNPARFEFYYSDFDKWFDQSIYPSEKGFSIYFKDITKRKLMIEALQEAYEKENEILESISDAFVAVDYDNNFTFINHKAKELLNIDQKAALDHNILELFSKAHSSLDQNDYNKSVQHNETQKFDYFHEPTNSWFHIRIYPSKNGRSIYFTDITKEKNQQETLKKLNNDLKDNAKRLEESNKELEQFAYVASHDLQEPLRMISSFLKLLQKKYENQLDDKAQTYINFAVDGTHRMRQIIIDLLEFSKAGTQEEKLEKLDLNEELEEVLSLLHSSVNEKNVDLKIEELPEVYYSRTAIRQLFYNLLGNAIKYSNLDGKPKIEVLWTENSKEIQFEIRDNGIGIEEKYKTKIFKIFQRLHGKSKYSGTGLGLAICTKLVERYGGTIWVESQLGKGSSFFFTLLKNERY